MKAFSLQKGYQFDISVVPWDAKRNLVSEPPPVRWSAPNPRIRIIPNGRSCRVIGVKLGEARVTCILEGYFRRVFRVRVIGKRRVQWQKRKITGK